MTHSNDYDFLFKILLIGDSGTGKSSLLQRYSENNFQNTYISTIGVDFKIKTIELDDKIIKLQIWDTSGQERFRSITSSYYRNAHGIIIVYDTTDTSSFEAVKMWSNEVDTYSNEYVQRCIVGNKIDLIQQRVVFSSDVKKYTDHVEIKTYEVSAKSGTGVNEIFINIARDIKIQFLNKIKEDQSSSIKLKPLTPMVKNQCC